MPSDDDPRLDDLEDRWLAEADAGRLLSAADLCPDDPALLPALEARVERDALHLTAELLAELYTATGKEAEAAKWRKEMEQYPGTPDTKPVRK